MAELRTATVTSAMVDAAHAAANRGHRLASAAGGDAWVYDAPAWVAGCMYCLMRAYVGPAGEVWGAALKRSCSRLGAAGSSTPGETP